MQAPFTQWMPPAEGTVLGDSTESASAMTIPAARVATIAEIDAPPDLFPFRATTGAEFGMTGIAASKGSRAAATLARNCASCCSSNTRLPPSHDWALPCQL